MAQVIVFDLGKVIADWDPRYLFSKIFADPMKVEFFLESVCNMAWLNQVNAGMPAAEAVRRKQAEFPEYATEIAAYFDRWEETIAGEIPGVAELVTALQDRGRPLYLFTNLPAEMWQRTAAVLPLLDRFDGYFISGIERLVKPDPAAYLAFAERFRVREASLFFVDDDAENVRVARAMGWDAYVFRSADRLRAEFVSRSLLP